MIAVSSAVAPHLVDRLRAIKAARLAAEDRVMLAPGEGPKLLTLEVISFSRMRPAS